MDSERKEILETYKPLRVADVADGMDWCMLHDVGLVSPKIRPLFRTRICEIAKTARYIPTNRKIPTMAVDEYDKFVQDWYENVCTWPFKERIEEGDVIVIDGSGLRASLIGSLNILQFMKKKIRGAIVDGGCRDTDEVIAQKCPVWCRHISTTMVQGRIEFASMDEPINCGGAKVNPGDIVVADGDGVIIVSRNRAIEVAKYARRELRKDKERRRKLYVELGLPLDDTVS